jgi:hypothetical protein
MTETGGRDTRGARFDVMLGNQLGVAAYRAPRVRQP